MSLEMDTACFQLAGVAFFKDRERQSLGIIFSFASQMALSQGILKVL